MGYFHCPASVLPSQPSRALCPELDIASQGKSVEEARRNLIGAIEVFFEAASPSEIQQRIHWAA